MNIFDRFRQLFNYDKFKNVRIEEIKPFQKNLEIQTATIWISDNNIEDSLKAVDQLGLKHLHLQTKNFDFLEDERV